MIKVALIGSDIRFDEVSIRAIKTFEYFDSVVDQIFDRIDARIEKNMIRISEINFRLERASKKIEKLKISKKAIRMYSPARYPIEHPVKFQPTFDSNFQPGDVDFYYKLNLPLESIQYKQYSDKLQFYHIKSPKREVLQQPNLIFHTTSINSLITFVNNENLYLKDSTKFREKDQQPVEQKIDDDTTDFSRFSTMVRTKQHGDNFHYLPSFNQAPDFEFPVDLPDLEGIAGDISFSVPDEELIEPTFRTMNIVNELPNVNELLETKKMDVVESFEPPPIPANLPLSSAPPPPPIPVSLIPPPPPPPPIPMPITQTAPSQSILQIDDARSSLMKAIRDAAGKAKNKMKSIPAADEQPAEDAKKPKQQAPAMDFMSDLYQKLLLRRKGIAGSKEARKEKSSIMAKVSSLIPPPPKKPPSSDDSETSESYDNDEDDWD